MKKSLLFAWTMLAVCLPLLNADSATKHPIDVWLTSCMEKDPSTKGLNACLEQAYGKWDLELNRVYQELSGRLSVETRAVLREGQRAWILFRNRRPGGPGQTARVGAGFLSGRFKTAMNC
jgi:uncharacterized protein YecT (DUF1311 family)